MFIRKFKIDRLEYKLTVSYSFNVALELTGGKTRGGESAIKYDEFLEEMGSTHAVGDVPNPLTVLRKCSEYIAEYISIYNPDYLIINSYYNQKRARVYLKLLNRFIKKYPQYEVSYSDVNSDLGYILVTKNKLLPVPLKKHSLT